MIQLASLGCWLTIKINKSDHILVFFILFTATSLPDVLVCIQYSNLVKVQLLCMQHLPSMMSKEVKQYAQMISLLGRLKRYKRNGILCYAWKEILSVVFGRSCTEGLSLLHLLGKNLLSLWQSRFLDGIFGLLCSRGLDVSSSSECFTKIVLLDPFVVSKVARRGLHK